jgi:hypothetical protein
MEKLTMKATMLRKDFETLLVKPPCLRNSDEAIAFDLRILASRPKLIRRLFRFECHPAQRNWLFVDGREVFVAVAPYRKDSLMCGVHSISTDVLKSGQEILPITFHQMHEVITNPAGIVSLAIDEIFGRESYGNN